MSTAFKYFGFTIATVVALFAGAAVALAQAPTVVFEETPLFLNANIQPGDSVARTITVTNTGTSAEEVYLSSANVFSTGLGEVMKLVVTAPGSTYFTGVFDDFFDDTPLTLGSVAGGETKVYTLSAALPSGVGNAYQTKQLGFDLIIGFVGGGSVTDNPGGARGGGGGGTSILRIFNEEVTSVVGDTATLSWNTNLNASTYLVCGVVGDIPFTLSAVPPLFGYQFTVPEADTDTKVHTVILSGLDIGEYECRPAGRVGPSEPFTVGKALQFAIGPDGLVAGVATSQPTIGGFISSPTGSVLGASGKGTFGGPTYEEWKAELEAERAAKAAADGTATSSSDGSDTESGSETGGQEGSEGVRFDFKISWYWFLLAALILGGVWYWRRSIKTLE
jgi:hypothetical protein